MAIIQSANLGRSEKMNEWPRTAADFENLSKASGGDLWNYNSPTIRNRLHASASFIEKHIGKQFQGRFVELGAFDGSFTRILLNTFPAARVDIIDISETAIAKAKRANLPSHRVRFFIQDLLTITNVLLDKSPTVVLALECLYYLNPQERRSAVENIRRQFSNSPIFVSTPIVGRHYFTESSLIELFTKTDYVLRGFRTLNLRSNFPIISPPIIELCDRHAGLRKMLANQVVYLFSQR